MSDGVLSQEEINALLNSDDPGTSEKTDAVESLTSDEADAIGEIANISMGTAATTLFSLVNKRVEISTPVVSLASWDEIVEKYEKPCVIVRIAYTKGLDGSNVLVLKESDVKVITDLMMGGDGSSADGEIGEIHLSAISEAMNQMMGSAATSLSSMLDKMIDISPPSSDLIDLQESIGGGEIDSFLDNTFVMITFKMLIEDLVDSEIMQLYPISLAKEMCASIMANMKSDTASTIEDDAVAPQSAPQPASAPQPQPVSQPAPQPAPDMPPQGGYMQPPPMQYAPYPAQQVNVQPAQFQPFAGNYPAPYQPENIDLIMDVPLEVTVELGRTHKSIQDILDFAPGTIIELNKIAGEPIDVLVNGKYVAKGEVVVIEESFGIRITEIMK